MITITIDCEQSTTSDNGIDLRYSVEKDGVFLYEPICDEVTYEEMRMIESSLVHVRRHLISAIKERHPEYREQLRKDMKSIKDMYQQPKEETPLWKRVLMDMKRVFKHE